MSSISSVSSNILSALFSTGSSKSSKSSASTTLDNLFSQLDKSDKGYIEKSDLATAFSAISSSSSSSSSTASTSTASVDDVFSKLDSNKDGKVTKDELTTGLENLAAALDSQFNQMRMSGSNPQSNSSNDTGFTKAELTQQLSSIGSSDSALSSMLNKVVDNFTAADTNSDGKVTFAETMAYDKSTSSSTSSTSSTASASGNGFTLAQLTQQLSDIGSTDSTRSSLINKIVSNFAAADTNADGKVSNSEAMAYDKSTSAGSASANDSTTSSDLAVLKRIMDLMSTYALTSSTDSNSNLLNTLSISA